MNSAAVRLVVASLFGALCLLSAPLHAALDGALFVEGPGGAIPGDYSGADPAREDSFNVNEMHHLIRNDGSATEHRQLIVTVAIGQGIPTLLQALDQQEALTVLLRLFRPNPSSGVEENYYNIELSGARLVAVEPIFPDNKVPENASFEVRARLRFEYAVIEQVYLPTGEQVGLSNP